MSENVPFDICAQRRRSQSAYSQSEQNPHWPHFWIANDAKFLLADNEDCNQTAQADLSLR